MKRNTLRFILRVSVLTFNKLKMKKLNLLTLALIGGIVFWSSCSKSSDCQDCHIALIMQDGSEHEHEIGEFCGDALEDIENNGYTLEAELTHMDTTYPVGHTFNPSEVHCEEHAH